MTKITKRSFFTAPLLSFDTSIHSRCKKSRRILTAYRKLCGGKDPPARSEPAPGDFCIFTFSALGLGLRIEQRHEVRIIQLGLGLIVHGRTIAQRGQRRAEHR